MNLITLNTWGGRLFEPLRKFLEEKSEEVDIFCFQEVFSTNSSMTDTHGARANLFNEIEKTLNEFQGFYASAQEGFDQLGAVGFDLSFGLASFVKKSIKIESAGDTFVFRQRNARKDDNTTIGRNLQYQLLEKNNDECAIFNFHGLWSGGDKEDNEDRLKQSRKIKDFISQFPKSKTIICGDFNLLPGTESLKILEDGMRNLVKEYHVETTRSRFYTKPEKFADYILVSPDINVDRFAVLDEEVSDHLPLFLSFT